MCRAKCQVSASCYHSAVGACMNVSRIWCAEFFALQGKKDWVGWFANFGIPDVNQATQILFFIGLLHLVVALIVLVKPIRVVLLWAVFWGFWTALLRPIVGQSILDFIERFANWAAPLALFYLYKPKE